MVLSKLTRKTYFHASQYTYCIVHWQSQQTFYPSAYSMVEPRNLDKYNITRRQGWMDACMVVGLEKNFKQTKVEDGLYLHYEQIEIGDAT